MNQMSEDFWNSSSTTGFKFDSEGDYSGGSSAVAKQLAIGFSEVGSFDNNISEDKNVEPVLENFMPEKSIMAILEGDSDTSFTKPSNVSKDELVMMLTRKVESRWAPSDINEVITRSLLGRPVSFEMYRSLRSKKELLRAAERVGDGDTILGVVLFLSRTLKKRLFHDILASSPIALSHYSTYLVIRYQINELVDLLDMLGKHKESSMRLFVEACSSSSRMLKRLQICHRDHFQNTRDREILDYFIKLLEWQQSYEGGRLFGLSVASSLSDLCLHKWVPNNATSGSTLMEKMHSPRGFMAAQGASEKLYQWVALNSRAKQGAWDDLHGVIHSKGWFGGVKPNLVLPLDDVIRRLSELNAPIEKLKKYVEYEDDPEKKSELTKFLLSKKSVN